MLQFLSGLFCPLISALKSLPTRSSGSDTPSSSPESSPESSAKISCTIPWGSAVSQTFRDRVVWCASRLEVPVDYLMAIMAFESAGTFRADIRNMAGSGATGLIQFMPATARGLGTTTDALAAMTPEDQLNYVYRYFLPHRGRLKTLSDVYMAVLWPRAIGQPENYVLWNKASRPTTYRQNAGLDLNKDTQITKAEAASRVHDELLRGRLPGNIWTGEVWPEGRPT